jgi:hypothetical protein
MAALPADIAKYTTDGKVITSSNAPLKAAHPEAEDIVEEIEMFFDTEADAQVLLDEKLVLRSRLGGLHEGVEVDESLGLGTTVPIAPTVPCYRFVDAMRGIDRVARVRAFAYESGTDRYSVELEE